MNPSIPFVAADPPLPGKPSVRSELMAALLTITKKIESLPDTDLAKTPGPLTGRISLEAGRRPLQQWSRDPESADVLCEVRRAIRRALDRGAITDGEVENVLGFAEEFHLQPVLVAEEVVWACFCGPVLGPLLRRASARWGAEVVSAGAFAALRAILEEPGEDRGRGRPRKKAAAA